MAKTTTALELKLDAKEAQQTVGSFKQQLREANAELITMSEKFGASSDEAVKAAKKVAGLKDAIGDAKALAETFNPDKKFVALGGALQGATAGFSALQGAMGLFGSENKKVEDALLKVQSAMALQQGISGVFGAIDSFKLFGAQLMKFNVVQKAVTAAQWLWNIAMEANPIGALVAVIAAVVAGIVALTMWFFKSAAASDENAKHVRENTAALEAQIDAQKRAADALKRNSDYQIAYAKASGASSKAIRELEQKLAMEAIAFARSSAEAAKNTYEKEQNVLASLKAADAAEEDIKAQEELTKNAQKNLEQQYVNLKNAKQAQLDLTAKHSIDVRQEQTNAHEKELQKQKEQHDKMLELQKKYNEDRKALQKELDDERLRRGRNSFAVELMDLQQQFEKRIERAHGDKQLLLQVEDAYNQSVSDKYREAGDNKFDLITSSDLKIAGKTLEINANAFQAQDAARKTDLASHIATQEQKMQTLKSVGDAMGALADIAGKQTAAGKALGIAQATINTFLGITEVWKSKSVLPEPFNTATKIAATITTAAGGFAAVKGILSTKVPGAAGAGGGGVPSIAAAVPITPQAQSTRLDQGQVNQIGNAVNARAYVLESDGASAQERRVRIERAARIN